MFVNACALVRDSIYAISGIIPGQGLLQLFRGSAFMIAPGVLVTTNANTRGENKVDAYRTEYFAGNQPPETADLIAHDASKNIALYKITNPKSVACVNLSSKAIPIGTPCGWLGFLLKNWLMTPNSFGEVYRPIERFQGGFISCFDSDPLFPANGIYPVYETDSSPYSVEGIWSGCPGFIEDGTVFGMQLGSTVQTHFQQGGFVSSLPISSWLPSTDIIAYAKSNGINI